MLLLSIERVSKSFAIEGGISRRSIGDVKAVRQVSLRITRGENLAIVGGSGCGKSTLARLIVGLLAPDAGTLSWEGQSMSGWSRRERARHIQMIFQDPYASLNPKLSIETQLKDVIRISDVVGRSSNKTTFSKFELRASEVSRRCVELLDSVGLSADALRRYPFQFSGGQRQRIAIARALALHPDLLIADEPLSALDVTIQAQIIKLFQTLKSVYGLTMLFITHDLSVLPGFADRVIVMKEGAIVEEGLTETVLHHPAHPYTQALLNALPRLVA